MHQELDNVIQFIIDALSANASKGQGSVVTIKIAPLSKKDDQVAHSQTVITADDVLDAHEALKNFDGDFRKLFSRKEK